MINVLRVERADTLVEPRAVAGAEAGARLLRTIAVADADAVCEELEQHGVTILNGPIDRPWGRRTVAFADPAGMSGLETGAATAGQDECRQAGQDQRDGGRPRCRSSTGR